MHAFCLVNHLYLYKSSHAATNYWEHMERLVLRERNEIVDVHGLLRV